MKQLLLLLTAISICLSNEVQSQETIRIGGTGLGTLLIQRVGDSYSKLHPKVQVKAMLPPLGSNGGLRALAAGAIAIAVVAPPASTLKPDENEAAIRIFPWVRTPFVFTGSDVVSNTKLTSGQVFDIYSGRRAEWTVGKPVRLITRTERESDTSILRAFSREMDQALTEAVSRTGRPFAENDVDNLQLLERIPGSFGAIGLGQLLLSESQLKPVSLDGIFPSIENLKSGAYRYEKPLLLIVSNSPDVATLEFIRYLRSPDALKIIGRYGFIPVER